MARRLAAWGEGGLAAVAAGLRAVAPATGVAAAAVTGVLLVDLLLLAGIVYGYRRLRPALSVYLGARPTLVSLRRTIIAFGIALAAAGLWPGPRSPIRKPSTTAGRISARSWSSRGKWSTEISR